MSDKPLIERLQVKGDRTLAVTGLPADRAHLFDPAAAAVTPDAADVTLTFAANRAALEAWLAGPATRGREGAIMWVAYPKLTSSLAGDLNRDIIHRLVRDHGLTTVAQIAIDDDWSAMRLKRTG